MPEPMHGPSHTVDGVRVFSERDARGVGTPLDFGRDHTGRLTVNGVALSDEDLRLGYVLLTARGQPRPSS